MMTNSAPNERWISVCMKVLCVPFALSLLLLINQPITANAESDQELYSYYSIFPDLPGWTEKPTEYAHYRLGMEGMWVENWLYPNSDYCVDSDTKCLFTVLLKFGVPECVDGEIKVDQWSVDGHEFKSLGIKRLKAYGVEGQFYIIERKSTLEPESSSPISCDSQEPGPCIDLTEKLTETTRFLYSCEYGLRGFGYYFDECGGNGRVYLSASKTGLFAQSRDANE